MMDHIERLLKLTVIGVRARADNYRSEYNNADGVVSHHVEIRELRGITAREGNQSDVEINAEASAICSRRPDMHRVINAKTSTTPIDDPVAYATAQAEAWMDLAVELREQAKKLLHDADCPMTNARAEHRTGCNCDTAQDPSEPRTYIEGGGGREAP